MEKVQIAFSIGRMPQDLVIQQWPACPGPFSHVQLLRNNEIVDSYPGIGVTVHTDFHGHYYGIVLCDIHADPEALDRMFADVKTQDGKKYDWRGIGGVVLNKNLQDPDDWFCSELDSFYLNKYGILPCDPALPPSLVVPNKLFQQGIHRGIFSVTGFIAGDMKL